jgi:hypothetical protein
MDCCWFAPVSNPYSLQALLQALKRNGQWPPKINRTNADRHARPPFCFLIGKAHLYIHYELLDVLSGSVAGNFLGNHHDFL